MGVVDDIIAAQAAERREWALRKEADGALTVALARAIAAERERDAYAAALATVHGDICRGDGHDTPEMTALCVVSAFASARVDHAEDLDTMTARANDAIAERDAALAKLADTRARLASAERAVEELVSCLKEQLADAADTCLAPPGHRCGSPDAACDGDCVEYARWADRRIRANAALRAHDSGER